MPLISPQSCRVTVSSDFENTEIESAPVFARTLVGYNISWSPSKMANENIIIIALPTASQQLQSPGIMKIWMIKVKI